MFRSVFIIKFLGCLMAGISVWPSTRAEEEENTGALQIESATEELSADIHIAREEGKEPPRSEEEDKKRIRLGIGEIISLSLTGKDTLIGSPEKTKWIISEGKTWPH